MERSIGNKILVSLRHSSIEQDRLVEWKYVLLYKCFPHRHEIRIIDRKDMNCGSANYRFAAKCGSCPLEVSIPLVRAGMEEPNKFACVRIGAGYVRTFVPIAMQAGEGEILKNS